MLELFLAWRYLKPQRNAVSVITGISLLGVMLGVAVLIVVTSVMTGFNKKMQDTLLTTISHVQISNPYRNYIENFEQVLNTVKKSGGKPLPLIKRECIIQAGETVVYKFLIGVSTLSKLSPFELKENIEKNARENTADTNFGKYDLGDKKIIISKFIADELKLSVGDKLIVHSPSKLQKMIKTDDFGKLNISKSTKMYLPEEYTISGLYGFDKRDFDKNIIFVDIDDAADLYELPWGSATAIYTWTDDAFNIEPFVEKLRKELPELRVISWKQLERRMLDVLSLQKVIMIFLLAFIVLVAAICILCTLITVVVQKRREIGIMKSLGATSNSIIKIFSLQGLIVGISGTAMGVILGLIIVHYRNDIVRFASNIAGRKLWNPEFYFFKDLPAVVNTSEVLTIGLISIILCTLGALIPAILASFVEPAKAMRSE